MLMTFNEFAEEFDKYIELEEKRVQRVNRIRGGQVQRRKKVTSKSGYKIKDGKAVRMKSSERLKRKRAARKAAKKRKGKKSQIQRQRKKSMKKRQRKGF